MSVTVVTSGGNLNVTTSQQVTGASQTATVENTDQSYQDTVEGGSTLVIPDITLTKFDDTTVTAVAAIDLDLGVIDPPADGAVENTDVSYSDTVASGGTLVIPDINITKNDDSVVTSPAAIDLDLRIIDPSAAPATWDEFVAEYGRGYRFPRGTTQPTSYRTGDAKDIETTIFTTALRNAQTLKARNTLATNSILTLNNTNSFGNTNRITDEAGGQTFAAGLRIDHLYGIMWKDTAESSATWNAGIDAALAKSLGGFSDWFMASVPQYLSISDPDTNVPYSAILGIGSSGQLWSSSTWAANTANALQVYMNQFRFLNLAKTNLRTYLICRKHF